MSAMGGDRFFQEPPHLAALQVERLHDREDALHEAAAALNWAPARKVRSAVGRRTSTCVAVGRLRGQSPAGA
jgi:hypothetical protein